MTGLFDQYLTELIVGGFLTIFAFAVRSWTGSLSRNLADAVRRIERVADRVQGMEVENAKQIATLTADVASIYKRMDRELVNGGH